MCMREFWAFFFLCMSLMLAWAGWARAGDVELTSRDGSITIEGTLLGYDGEFYRVQTIYGPLTLDRERVDCDGPGCPDLTSYVPKIRLSGTRRMTDVLIPSLILAFAERKKFSVVQEVVDDTEFNFLLSRGEQKQARFSVRAGTTAQGYSDLIAEKADIAMVLREPNDEETEQAAANRSSSILPDRRARVIALDGIVAIKAPNQPVDAISLDDFVKIVSGRNTDWSDLGGAEHPVALHLPTPTSGVFEAFTDQLVAPKGLSPNPVAQLYNNLGDLADTVSSDSISLGLTTLSEIGNATTLSLTGSCGFKAKATIDALRAEDYPLTLPLMLYTPARRLPLVAREFLEFAHSPYANIIVRRAGFVDQSISTDNFDDQGDRLAHAIAQAGDEVTLADLQEMIHELRDRDRLSTTFRFRDGTKLDAQSQENILRFAHALEVGSFDGKDILLAGFSDSEGPAAQNLKLSRARAETILNHLKKAAPAADFTQLHIQIKAFGETLPMACDDTEWGRATNRRVEIWVK